MARKTTFIGHRLIAATRLARWERLIRDAAVGVLKKHEQRILAQVRSSMGRSTTIVAAIPADAFGLDTFNEEMYHAVSAVGSGIYADIQGDVAKMFAHPGDLPQMDVENRLDRMIGFMQGLGPEMADRVGQTLQEGVSAGESIDALSARVSDAFGVAESRATLIARTEVVGAANGLSHDYASAVNDSGALTLNKTWLATMDEATRPAHEDADGQEVGMDESFDVDGEEMDYPGDPNGSPDNVCNCRCTLIYTEADQQGDETVVGESDTEEAPDEAQIDEPTATDESVPTDENLPEEDMQLPDESTSAADNATPEDFANLLQSVPETGAYGYVPSGENEADIAFAKGGDLNAQYVDFVNRWTDPSVDASAIGQAAVDGSTPDGQFLAQLMDNAPQIDGELYRGTGYEEFPAKAVGDTFELNPSSFSRAEESALGYSDAYDVPAIIQVDSGAFGVPIDGLGQFPGDQEVISGGKFTVTGIEERDGVYYISVTQGDGTAAEVAAPTETVANYDATHETFYSYNDLIGKWSDWATDLTTEQRDALSEYQGDSAVNAILRGQEDGSVQEMYGVDIRPGLDQAIADGYTPTPMSVYRGLDEEGIYQWLGKETFTDTDLQAMVGREFVDAGYVSTSIDIDAAMSFSGKDGARLVYHLPENFNAASMPAFRPSGITSQFEQELLLARGQAWRIVGAERTTYGAPIFHIEPAWIYGSAVW